MIKYLIIIIVIFAFLYKRRMIDRCCALVLAVCFFVTALAEINVFLVPHSHDDTGIHRKIDSYSDLPLSLLLNEHK